MNRRWQKEGSGRYETLPSLGSMLAQLPPLTHDAKIADIADVYSAYSTLHAKSRNPRPMANSQRSFYYFIADAPVSAQRHMEEAAAAQEGMPLPPQSGKVRMEHVVPISSKYGGLTMERLRSLFFLGLGTDCASNSGDAAHAAGRADHAPAAARSSTLDAANAPPGQGAATAGVRSSGLVPHEGLLRGSETGQGKAAGRQQGASSEEKGSGENRQGNSLSCQPALQPASHIMLAIADDDGSVSLMRLFSHIQPPFEGPEALPDAMGGEEGGADSDEDG